MTQLGTSVDVLHGGHNHADMPVKDLIELQPDPDLESVSYSRNARSSLTMDWNQVVNPAPRIAILHALTKGQTATSTEEEYKELRILFELWRSAGKNINLWDWLEGFRESMADRDDAEDGQEAPDVVANLVEPESNGHIEPVLADDVEMTGLEEEQDRLHAIFIRFCEEARMLGIVRARGRTVGKRGDEIVKGIGL